MMRSRSFPCRAESIPASRRFTAVLLETAPDETRETVLLLISELVTNSILHTRSDATLRIDIKPDLIRVEVTDAGPGQPAPRTPGPEEAHGRGLQVVAALAHEWGVDPASGTAGKTVWFTYRPGAASPV